MVLNGKKIKVSSFQEYVNLYELNEGERTYPKVHEIVNNRWEVVMTVSEGQFFQASFVNAICTSRGGTHVNVVTDQIAEKICEQIKKKNKVRLECNSYRI